MIMLLVARRRGGRKESWEMREESNIRCGDKRVVKGMSTLVLKGGYDGRDRTR